MDCSPSVSDESAKYLPAGADLQDRLIGSEVID